MDTRITICLTDGAFRGASHTNDNGLPAELDLSQLAAIAPTVNTAALARVTELEAELATAATAKTDAEAAQESAESAQATAEAQAATLTEQLATAQAQIDALLNPPAVVTIRSWQAKAVLSLAGLLAPAEAVIDSLDEPQRTVVKSAWDNNADFSRQSSTVLALAAALSLTDDQLDAMFAQASALTV